MREKGHRQFAMRKIIIIVGKKRTGFIKSYNRLLCTVSHISEITLTAVSFEKPEACQF